ncbi:hypothetical protein MHBO_004383 [Bonamia ostreae]|uniref:Uncharacterized protein n=1 Tax=Bonamia ostreae TaxID=126728 RepID=A0ABV2ATD8_9EUKA
MKIQPGQQEKKTVNFRVPSKKKEWKKPQQKIFGLPSNRAKNSSAKQRGSKKKVVGASAPKIPSKNKSYRKTRDISKWEKLKNKGKPENGSTVEKDCNIKMF